jgi:UDP-galactopyranose mutase
MRKNFACIVISHGRPECSTVKVLRECGYTEKQWGKPCKELDKSIIRRIPLRFTYNNNYFNAKYQGIPVDGYSKAVERLLEGVEVVTGYKCSSSSKEWLKRAKKRGSDRCY